MMLTGRLHTRLRVEQSLMIAPLLDIMFLVLLFFILNTSDGSVESFDVEIPQVHQSENRQPSTQIVVILRQEAADVWLNERQIALTDFVSQLQQTMQQLQSQQILLLAGQEVDYGRIMQLMELMKQAGAHGVSLGVEKVES